MILVMLGGAWLTGAILGSYIDIPLLTVFSGLPVLFLIPFLKRYRKQLILSGLCLSALCAGIVWHDARQLSENDGQLRYYNETGTIIVRGTIVRPPEHKEGYTRFHLDSESILIDEQWNTVSGTALVFLPRSDRYTYGDRIEIEGNPQTPPELDGFDYENYLAVKGIYTTFWYPDTDVINTDQGNPLLQRIYSFRDAVSSAISRTIPEPQASVINAMLLGKRSDVPEPVNTGFSLTGTAHILAISGLHLAIIAGLFLTLGIRLLGRQGYWYIWIALAVVWLYAILSGLNPPVVRAGIMITLYLAAELFGRQRNAVVAIVVAASVMTAFDPQILRDASFQMSFAAMTGLVFLFPPLRRLTRNLVRFVSPENSVIRSILVLISDSLSVSTAAVLAVWPLVAYYFGIVSPAAPLATLFILPFLPVAIVVGMIGGIVGTFFLPLAQGIGWITWFVVTLILKIVDIFTLIPSLAITSVDPIWVILYYIGMALVIIYLTRKYRKLEPDDDLIPFEIKPLLKRYFVPVALGILAVAASTFAVSMPEKDLGVSFLDVGQGDAILIQKGSRQIVIDGGPSPGPVLTGLGTKMPFWDRTIDLVILTHPDADHISGLMELLGRYRIGKVVYPEVVPDSSLLPAFLDRCDRYGIPTAIVQAGQYITLGDDVRLDSINPDSAESGTDMDNSSIVLHLVAGNIDFLLTGDIMEETEYRLLSDRAVSSCTVLKIAHHGSATSTSSDFLNVVRPQIAVISSGKDNRFRHPSSEVLNRLGYAGIDVYRTDTLGTIEFITDGTSLRVITEK